MIHTEEFHTLQSKLSSGIQEIQKVIRGQQDSVLFILTSLIAGGHILIEDNPGSGKTVTARAVAATISKDLDTIFKRVQFTPDLLPMDLIGTHIYNEKENDFIFKKGPLFTNILLVDEINRASPKVQSALLESMAEGQISVGDTTYLLDEIFFVMATQNPIETEGTYPLPTAQLDRFFMKIYFGYVDEETELDIYRSYLNIQNHLLQIQAQLSLEDIKKLRKLSDLIDIHDEILKSVNRLVRTTRTHDGIVLGASVRAGIALIKCLKTFALISGRDYVIEDDLHRLAYSVLHHRLLYKNPREGKDILQRLIDAEVQNLVKMKLR